jgi:hypothetical protein
MASFTDNPQLLSNFNPYVQQLPVDAMREVGMYKQAKYDEGVQRIQTSIDNVAGLDIYKDSDKGYLQSKLNQLGNDLKTVAAGDFSNFQLVNSTAGMANQLAKDENVQNAVSSTAWYKKQSADMETAIKEGKASQANIYDFTNKANKWLGSNEVGESFRERYTPYRDIKKTAMEAIKALHPKLSGYDIPFEVINGKVNTKKIADAMQRYKIEGIDENQIKQAISASFTPEDNNQMYLDAKYQFKGIDTDQLISKATTEYNSNKKVATLDLEYLRSQKQIVTDPTKLEQLDSQISAYEKLLGIDGKAGELDEQYAENIKDANEDPDKVKYNIYKDGFVKEFANGFSWKNQEMQYVTNPLRAQQNFVAEMKQKQEVENRQRYEFGVNTGLKQQELQLKAEENALKKIELYGDPSMDAWTNIGNETDNELRAIELFTGHTDSVNNNIESSKSQLRQRYTDGQINTMLLDWENSQGVASKATKVPAGAVELIKNIAKDNNYLRSLKTFEDKTRLASEKEAGVDKIIQSSLQGKTGIKFNYKGEQLGLTPREIVEVTLAETPVQVRDNYGHTVTRKLINTAKLNSKQLKYVEGIYGKSSLGVYKNGELVPSGQAGNPIFSIENRTKLDQITRPHIGAANIIRGAYNKSEEIYKQKLGKVANTFVPRIKAVAGTKDGSITPVVSDRLSQLLTAINIKGIGADENFDLSKASEMLLDKNNKDTRVFVKQDGDNYEVQISSLTDLANRQVLKVSKNDVYRYLGPQYINDRTEASTRMTIGKGNTNLTGNPLHSVMQKQFGNFPGIKKLQITADLNQDLSNPDLYTPIINIKKKDGSYASFELSGNDKAGRVGYDQGLTNLDALTDDVILKKLKQEYPNYDFSKLDY